MAACALSSCRALSHSASTCLGRSLSREAHVTLFCNTLGGKRPLRPCCGVTGWGTGERPTFCCLVLLCHVGCGPHCARPVPWSAAPAEALRARHDGPWSQVQPLTRGPVSEQRVLSYLSARSLLSALTSQVSACDRRDVHMVCRWQGSVEAGNSLQAAGRESGLPGARPRPVPCSHGQTRRLWPARHLRSVLPVSDSGCWPGLLPCVCSFRNRAGARSLSHKGGVLGKHSLWEENREHGLRHAPVAVRPSVSLAGFTVCMCCFFQDQKPRCGAVRFILFEKHPAVRSSSVPQPRFEEGPSCLAQRS